MKQIDHIGIAVRNLDQSIPVYERLLQARCYKTERVEQEQVTTAFFQAGDSKIELLEGTASEGVIARFIEKRGEGLHHIAFRVEDIHAEMHRLKAEGFELLSDAPKAGADDMLICFLHPKHTHGVLVEICQKKTP